MTAPTTTGPLRKPYDEEIDVYGLTHPGKVRTDNQDHFLICSLRKQIVVPPDQPARRRQPHGRRASGSPCW